MLMSRTSTTIILGILIILTPFSGLPVAIRSLLLVVFGLGVLMVGFSMRKHEVSSAAAPVMPNEPTPEPAEHPVAMG